VNPSTFESCGPPHSTLSLTAHCLVSATQCKGTYSGTIQIFQPSKYRTIPPNLVVTIVVT
jgi:hypothetical protein